MKEVTHDMALLEGTVEHPNGTFEITLDTATGEFEFDPFFETWFRDGAVVPGRDGKPVDRQAEPERWFRALAVQFRHHPLRITEVPA